MLRNWLLAHWRRMAMQAALCGVLGVTIALAALVAHEKRLALRLPLNKAMNVGRLSVALPRGWAPPLVSDETSAGDSISVEEVLTDGLPGRRISIERSRAAGLESPLEHLLHTPYLSEKDLTGSTGVEPARVQPQKVADWPGVMVSRAVAGVSSRHVQQQVLACAVMPGAQAVVIRLEGPRSSDEYEADEELVRQLAETVAVHDGERLKLPETGGTVELDGIVAAVPDHFYRLPADEHRTSRDLLADGSSGAWTSAELIPCLWLPGNGEETLPALLAARDPEWRGGPVKVVDDGIWSVDRLDGGLFPSRAYLFTNGEDQALLTILRGSPHDERSFDAVWRAISAGVRFAARKEIAARLENGRREVKRIVELGVDQLLTPQAGRQVWSLWDQNENADQQSWMDLSWGLTQVADDPSPDAPNVWWGARRTALPSVGRAVDGRHEEIKQSWSSAADFSRYAISTDRIALGSRSELLNVTPIHRWEVREGKLRNLLISGEEPKPVPDNFIPGGWLPLILGHVGDKPMILRTESFVGCDAASAPSLLTLTIARVPGGSMDGVTVIVNGTGQITRWWYAPDGTLRYIDFPRDLRAKQSGPGR